MKLCSPTPNAALNVRAIQDGDRMALDDERLVILDSDGNILGTYAHGKERPG
jgi:hypothetical protein